MRLLIVEDEDALADPLARGLRREGYAVDVACDGDEACALLDVETYDLVVLDLNLPRVDGLEVLRRVRPQQPDLLIVVTTARTRLEDRIAGLDLGADDYLIKPFHLQELSARIRALFRRDLRAREPLLIFRDLKFDPAQHAVWQDGRRLTLTRKELAILEYLMRRPGEIVSQEVLLDHVWDADVNPFTNVVPVHVNSLRNKLGDNSRVPIYIRTVVGHGYQLVTLDEERTRP